MKQEEPTSASPPPRRIIERPRLLNQLDETEARTILLVAPAGYGKTTLLRQWAQKHAAACWYTADSGSSDLAKLAIGLAAGLETTSPGLCTYVSQVVQALSNPTRELSHIVDAFAGRRADLSGATAIIDDYHLLGEGELSASLVRELSDRLNLRLLVGSRTRPSWATARGTIYGDLLEISSDELALTPDEVTDILGKTPAALTSMLLTHANGWPAVIGLAALARTTIRTPDRLVSSTLFRFFAEELFTSANDTLQAHLPTMALLPSLSNELTETVFGDVATTLLADAVAQGFVTSSAQQHDLHPLIREYLLSKLSLHSDVNERVSDGVKLSLRLGDWDNAFALITRFGRVDLVEIFLTSAFKPLVRSGRISTLEKVATFARSRSASFSPSAMLIDAELALRDGLFVRAEVLGSRAAEGLGPSHVLAAHAHWVAGQGAQLCTHYSSAPVHFRRAHDAARDEDDTRDALWGLVLTSTYSEASTAGNAVRELQKRRDMSPVDLVRATTAMMTLRRYTTGFAKPLDVESATHNLSAVSDPRVRTSFTNTHAFQLILAADYYKAHQVAELTREEASTYQLAWAVPHAEWALAASALGYRDFAVADRWLRRVERAADVLNDGHLSLNSAVLRARFLLALQRPGEARDALIVGDDHSANPAMKAELTAMKAVVSSVLGEADVVRLADEARAMTTAVDVHALVACADAISQKSDDTALRAFALAESSGVSDALVCAMRASPPLLIRLTAFADCRPRIQTLLRRCNDFDLARRAGIRVGARPRLQRPPLSRREYEVLQLVRQGLTNKEIAAILFISAATAKVHVRHILDKTGSRTRTEAASQTAFDF